MKKVKVYALAESKEEVMETLSNLISCLDHREVAAIESICVFDIKRENEYRGYTTIILKKGETP